MSGLNVYRDCLVDRATRHGRDDSRIVCRWMQNFRTHADRLRNPLSVLYDGTGSFLQVKRPGRGVDHSPPSSAEVKERVDLYLPLWAFMVCYRVKFTFTFGSECNGVTLKENTANMLKLL